MDKKELLDHLKWIGFPSNIIRAFKNVERKDFIEGEMKSYAYDDTALPIGHGQSISQPYTIAIMLTLLELRDNQKILEVGSGTGYVLALLSRLSKGSTLYGIERIGELAEKSAQRLKGYKNIMIINANGYDGLPQEAPFDRILVSASAYELPKELLRQLASGGIAVIPVEDSLMKIKKNKDGFRIEEYPGFVFVPLVHKYEEEI